MKNPILLSFHNNPDIKAKLLHNLDVGYAPFTDVAWAHDGADSLEEFNAKYMQLAAKWGIPAWLVFLARIIGTSVSARESIAWDRTVVEALPVGVNLDPVAYRLMVWRLERLIEMQYAAIGISGAHDSHVVRVAQLLRSASNVFALRDTDKIATLAPRFEEILGDKHWLPGAHLRKALKAARWDPIDPFGAESSAYDAVLARYADPLVYESAWRQEAHALLYALRKL